MNVADRIYTVSMLLEAGLLDCKGFRDLVVTYYPDEYDDAEEDLAALYGTWPGGYGAPAAPAAPPGPKGPPPPKVGDRWPGKCPKCGNERMVVWHVDWPTISIICKLCGKEQQVKRP